MSTQAQAPRKGPRSTTLVVAVLALTLVVMLLGGTVLVLRLRPDNSAPTKTEQALDQWQQAVEENPDSADAQTGLGIALLRAGETAQAQEAFEEALRLAPKAWMPSFQLALLFRETNPDRALALFRSAAKNAPPQSDKAVVLIAMGDFLMAGGDFEGARDAYQGSVADVPYLFDSHYGLAQAFEQLGETKQAIKEYKEALRFAPGDERITEALKRLRSEQSQDGS
jgi:tetratricopeptide (TPR) repeat protein